MPYGVYVSGCANCPFFQGTTSLLTVGCYLDDDQQLNSDDIKEAMSMGKDLKYPSNCPLKKHKVVAISLEN